MDALIEQTLTRSAEVKALSEERGNSNEIKELIIAMRTDLKEIIIAAPTYCHKGKSIDGMLWKLCYHKQIEQYRLGIKQIVSAIENTPLSKAEDSSVQVKIDKAKRKLFKLREGLKLFLIEAILFYQEFMQQLEQKHNLREKNYLSNIYDCLLYLGDLSRYQQLYSDDGEHSYSEAVRYYERASLLVPSSGNAHNQLAVLATYSEQDCVAVYHYCRSVLVKEPMYIGYTNLNIIFEKQSKLFEELKANNLLNSTVMIGKSSKKDEAMIRKQKQFFVCFIKLHAIIFKWSKSANEIVVSRNITSSPSSSGPTMTDIHVDIDQFLALMNYVLDEFDQLIVLAEFGELMLIRLLSICIFSVHYGHIDYAATEKEASIMTSLMQHRSYSTGESLALLLIYEILNKCIIRLAGDLVISSNSSNNKKLNEKITSRLLPLLNVFIEWIQCNTKYMPASFDATMSATVNNIMGNLTPKLQELVSSEHIMQILSKSMSTLLANIQSLRAKYSTTATLDTALKRIPLPEHSELNGFLPLSEVHRLYFNTPSSCSQISHEVIAVPDDVSKSRRISTLVSLLDTSTNPSIVPRTDEEPMNQAERIIEDVMQVQVVNRVVGGLLPISVLNKTSDSSSEKKKTIKKPKKNHDDKRLWTPSSSTEMKSVKCGINEKRSANKRGDTNNSTRSKEKNAMEIDKDEEVEALEEEEVEVVMMEDDNTIPSQENVVNTMFGVPGMFNWLQNNENKVPLNTAAIAADTHTNITSSFNYFEKDVEEEEEEVVFRPAFSRVRSNSPALQLGSSIRGIQSQNSFGDLLLGCGTDTTRTWSGASDPVYPERTIFSNIIDTTFALLDDSAESVPNTTYSYQTQHSSNSVHVQPPPGFG